MLLPGMTVEDMKSGVSRIRNPVIARVFRELHLIEQWGSGLRWVKVRYGGVYYWASRDWLQAY